MASLLLTRMQMRKDAARLDSVDRLELAAKVGLSRFLYWSRCSGLRVGRKLYSAHLRLSICVLDLDSSGGGGGGGFRLRVRLRL